jgi:hypothetical protein
MPPEKGKTEVDKFFEDLPSEETQQGNIFEDEKTVVVPVAPAKADDTSEEGEHKNRRHRRLERQLQQERELRIAAEARAAGRAEATQAGIPVATEVPEEWLQMYGDTPEARRAWTLQTRILDERDNRIRIATIAEMDAKAEAVKQEESRYADVIENGLESIEDEFNVDVTSDSPQARKARREFLELVQELSPKDENDAITGYADFNKTWEIYQERKKAVKPDATKNKDLADRTMERGSDGLPVEKQRTPGFFGWQKDMQI